MTPTDHTLSPPVNVAGSGRKGSVWDGLHVLFEKLMRYSLWFSKDVKNQLDGP